MTVHCHVNDNSQSMLDNFQETGRKLSVDFQDYQKQKNSNNHTSLLLLLAIKHT